MIVLNFSHPLTSDHLAQLGTLAGEAVERVVEVAVQVDHDRPLAEQMAEIVEAAGLESREWQTLSLVVNLPGYAPAGAALLAELQGRMGYFPSIIRLRPVAGGNPPRFELAEILNLQEMRDAARTRR